MTEPLSDPPDTSSTWTRLRRRKVVQWGLGYAAVAWALLQVFGFAADTFAWPALAKQLATLACALGLPVAIALAWFHGDRGEQRVTRLEVLVLTGLIAAAGGVAWIFVRHSPVAPSPASPVLAERNRIAILPFANLSNDPANAAFVGGVHDTLITQVAKVPGLSVISRSSVMQFAEGHPTIRQVAAALDVGSVLEGSVQRDGKRLRIQAQLIDAASDAHLWAETYDRNADDLFAVQSEIAQAVAQQLRIHLTADDAKKLAASLTHEPAAYEHYVLGRNFVSRSEWQNAIEEFTTAVTIDPAFAAAHAQLGLARTWVTFDDPGLRSGMLPLAKASIDRALELDPTLPEAHLALANYLYRGEPDIERAAAEFEIAIAGLPSDAQAHHFFALLRRWQKRWDDASALFLRAAQLDPRGDDILDYILSLVVLGHYDEAARAIDEEHRARPDDVALALWKGDLALNVACDLTTMEKVLEEAAPHLASEPNFVEDEWTLSMLTGDVARALDALERGEQKISPADDLVPPMRGLSLLAAGRRSEAARVLQAAIEKRRRSAENREPGEMRAVDYSAVASYFALLGDRAAAIRYAGEASANLPPSGEGTNREDTLYWSAVALGQVGESALAVARVYELLAGTSLRKAPGLWCDPFLEPLRADPAFQKLMSEHGVDTRIDPRRRETWPPPRFAR